MSPERRNELLAKGLCFTCEEPGHLARNCPKTTTVTSKKKGRPPGLPSNGVSIGPYPCEDPLSEDEVFDTERFGVCKLNNDEHIIFDHETGDDVLINSVLLENQEFSAGLWYARKRHELMGLDPDTLKARNLVPRAHRIGDIVGESVASFLEFMQPFPGDERVPWADERRDNRRFKVVRVSRDYYEISDVFPGEITILPLAFLRVPHFQLARWYASHLAQQLEVE
ncbi:hypothetical protein B0H12DRAFT_962040, partial [Mycena haematopus]